MKKSINFLISAIITVFFITPTFGQEVKPQLTAAFGTLVKMNIEIVDGDELNDKGHQGSFLFRVKNIDSIPLSNSLVFEFQDETGKFPADEFQLYKYLYGKETGTLSAETSAKMKKKYVGKTFTVMAYETGAFTGVPDGYFKYRPVRQDYGFHFRHWLVVVAIS